MTFEEFALRGDPKFPPHDGGQRRFDIVRELQLFGLGSEATRIQDKGHSPDNWRVSSKEI
jgi:hypothetical protein